MKDTHMKTTRNSLLSSLYAAVLTLSLTTEASARSSQRSRYEVVELSGQMVLLLPQDLSKSILEKLKSSQTEDDKIKLIHSFLTIEAMEIGIGGPTFCSEAAMIYKSPARDEAETKVHCEDVLQRRGLARDIVEGSDEEYLKTVTASQFREQISQFVSIALKM